MAAGTFVQGRSRAPFRSHARARSCAGMRSDCSALRRLSLRRTPRRDRRALGALEDTTARRARASPAIDFTLRSLHDVALSRSQLGLLGGAPVQEVSLRRRAHGRACSCAWPLVRRAVDQMKCAFALKRGEAARTRCHASVRRGMHAYEASIARTVDQQARSVQRRCLCLGGPTSRRVVGPSHGRQTVTSMGRGTHARSAQGAGSVRRAGGVRIHLDGEGTYRDRVMCARCLIAPRAQPKQPRTLRNNKEEATAFFEVSPARRCRSIEGSAGGLSEARLSASHA